MGKKQRDAATICDQVAIQPPHDSPVKAEKKKNKKNRDHENENEDNPKRKLEETEPQDITEPKTKKSKKDKKSKQTTEEETVTVKTNGVDNGGEDESERDGHVVITGKNIKDEKFLPFKSFSSSGLPNEVLECCKSFERPSPIQARAWPFLLNGRDLIGIAATGSGICVVCVVFGG